MSAVNEWMSKNFLKLNLDNTEILIVGPKHKRDPLLAKLRHLALQTQPQVKKNKLGVILEF